MVRQANLLSDLQSIAGVEDVRPGGDEFAVDGIAPRAVVRPATVEAAAAVIGHANATRLAVIPIGGKQQRGLGNVPSRYDIALDVTRLSAIVEYEPKDLTITCGAGMTLGELRKTTAAAGQMVAFDQEIADEATIGGALAADLWGPSRVSLGGPRDFTIGLRVITGDGLITRAGGRVVKNVAGYDLCKLYVGSLGTLAVITEATFKVQPLPKTTRQVAFTAGSAAEACGIASESLMRGLSLQSAVVTRADERWRLDITLAGSEAAVERSAREIASLSGDRRQETRDRIEDAKGGPIGVRIATLPSELPSLLEGLPADARFLAYPTLGVVRMRLRDEGELPPLVAMGAIVEDGGSVLMPAWTMEGVGRMALVSDPLGAPFYIMASEDERPSRAFAEHGTAPAIGHVVWNERIASDPDRALGFFGRHFGWTQQGGMPMGELGEYRFLADGPVMLGALMGVPPGEQPGWRFYFAVDDIDAAAARIREAGGGIEMEPMEIPGGEYSLSARDPQGARFGLVGPRR